MNEKLAEQFARFEVLLSRGARGNVFSTPKTSLGPSAHMVVSDTPFINSTVRPTRPVRLPADDIDKNKDAETKQSKKKIPKQAMAHLSNSISVLSANCQGLRNYAKRLDVIDYFKETHASIVCMQDTHLTEKDSNAIKTLWGNDIYLIGGQTNSRGVAILLNNNYVHPLGGGHIIFAFSAVRRPTWFPDILGNSSYPIFTKFGMQVYWVNSLYGIAFDDDSSIAN